MIPIIADVERAPARLEIVIVGAGENAEIAYEYFTHDSPHTVVGFSVEEGFLQATELYGLPVVAFEELEQRFAPDRYAAFVALSSQQLNRVRTRLFDAVRAKGYRCASYVSSRAFCWHNVEIGANTMIFEDNVLQHHVRVGDNVVLWSGSVVAHRAAIEDNVFVAPGVVISGYCTIGESSYLGANCTFNDGITVGHDVVVGSGAVVIRDLAPRGVYVGSPAKATGRDSFATFGVETG